MRIFKVMTGQHQGPELYCITLLKVVMLPVADVCSLKLSTD